MLINAYENRGHQRFTMAHEFGHYIFEYDGKSDFTDEYSLDKERLTSETEIRVNRFATALLMPKVSETFILKRIRELGLEEESNEKTIWNLLKNFRFAE